MKKTGKRIAACLLALALLSPAAVFGILPPEAKPLGDEAYTNVAFTSEANGCYSTQGLGAGEKYLYSVQAGDDDMLSIVHRVDPATGEDVLMRYNNSRRTYFRDFRHANDVDVLTLDGTEYLLVIADTKLLMLQIDGDSMSNYGAFDITYNGNPFNPSSLAVYRISAKKVMLLFRHANTLSLGVFDRGATSGTIPVSIAGTIDTAHVPVAGQIVDFDDFTRQGFGYKNGVVFLSLAGCFDDTMLSLSVILCYDVSKFTTDMKPIADMVYFIDSKKYAALFELEGCAVMPDGRLYVNANRRVSSYSTNHDGIMRINDLIFGGEGTGACRHYRLKETAAPEYLAAAANCHSGARYYQSCIACGAACSGTFEVGEKDAHNHDGGTEARGGVTVCLGCGAPLDGAETANAGLTQVRRLLAAAGEIVSAMLRGNLALPVPDPGDLWRRAEP